MVSLPYLDYPSEIDPSIRAAGDLRGGRVESPAGRHDVLTL